MNALNLQILMKEAKLSPESLGEVVGVSGMTIRRWTENPTTDPLPDLYQPALRDAIFKLVVEGKLSSESKSARKIFTEQGNLSQLAALKAMGFPELTDGAPEDHQEKVMLGLAHIGSLKSRRKFVEQEQRHLAGFKKLGHEWNERISLLWDVVVSKKLTSLDKLPAYGALFYLFMVFDLIPDTIPVFGLMDDFAILGIAAAYYVRRQVKA